MINKYDCDSRIYRDNLTEEDAWALEKERILELQLRGEAETNIHVGGNGGDTVTSMSDEDYKKFCRKVGDATLRRCQNVEYRVRLARSITEAMQKPEIKKKVSDRTKAAMQSEKVKELM